MGLRSAELRRSVRFRTPIRAFDRGPNSEQLFMIEVSFTFLVGSTLMSERSPLLTVAARACAVGGHVIGERARPRRPRSVPVSPEDLTREWLQATLCAGHPDASVLDFETTPASIGTSTRWQLRVAYDDAGTAAALPTRMFAKTTIAYRQRMLLGLAGVIEGEPAFYNHFRNRVEIEAPVGYYAAVDPASWRALTLTDDLAVLKGATFGTPVTETSRAEIEDLLTNMARWHARFQEDPELPRLAPMTPLRIFELMRGMASFRKRAAVGARRCREVYPRGQFERHDALYEGLEEAMRLASTGPTTLLHGDAHLGNTYRTADGRMGFADWQLIKHGSWAYDFAVCVVTGLAVEDRQAWERSLLEHYLEQVALAGGRTPDLEEAWLAYRISAPWAYFGWTWTIGRSALQPRMQPDEVARRIVERGAHAMQDLDPLGAVRQAQRGGRPAAAR